MLLFVSSFAYWSTYAVSTTGWWGLFSGFGGAAVLFASPYIIRGIKELRRRRKVKKELTTVGLADRVAALEVAFKALNDSVTKILQFIEGSEDPFTKEISGGLLAFMARIETWITKMKKELPE